MKNKFIFTSLILLLCIGTFAQNSGMSYQAVIRNSNGELVANQSVAATIKVRIGSTDVFNQTYQANTNAHGLLTVNFADPVFMSLNWQNAAMSCEVRQGSSVYMAENFQTIVAVPLSFYATSMNRDTLHAYLNSDGLIISLRSALHDSITDVRNYMSTFITTETDPLFNAWDKSTGISITESQISDLGNYLESETQNLNDVLTQNTSAGNQKITNLADPVNPQDAATKAYIDALLVRIDALEEAELLNHGYTDLRDGNHYNVVKIGDQLWMAENLKYLPSVVNPGMYSPSSPACYVYGYDGMDVAEAKTNVNYATYGVLYNWNAAVILCPSGWHLPSEVEWTQLTSFLGGSTVGGGKLKETGTTHWADPNVGATDEYGFSALPGGFYAPSVRFSDINLNALWWSSEDYGSSYAIRLHIYFAYPNIYFHYSDKAEAYSVRCVRD